MTATGLFNRLRETRVRTTRRIVLTGLIVMLSAFALFGIAGLRINDSPSLPIGLYLVSSQSRTSLVEFCPAEPIASLALSRGYRDRGVCGDGGEPLLKPIVARAGDLVDISVAGIAVNRHLLPNTAPLRTDRKDRPLTPWAFGQYVVQAGTVWVASSYNRGSFDSRYFGPVLTSSIREYLRPLLTSR